MLPQAFLLRQLLIKAEHGALLLTVNVASPAAAGHEERVGRGRSERGEGGGTRGVGTSSCRFWIYAGYIAGAAATGVVDVGGGDGGVGFGDVVFWGHFGGCCGCDLDGWW